MKLQSSDITPREWVQGRRGALRHLLASTSALALGTMPSIGAAQALAPAQRPGKLAPLPAKASALPGAQAMDKLTAYKDASGYNNFYEFGTDKSDPAANAHTLKTTPWTVDIEGLVKKPGRWALEDLLALSPMEERIYRLRCVEGWSMVIPWVGLARFRRMLGLFVFFYALLHFSAYAWLDQSGQWEDILLDIPKRPFILVGLLALVLLLPLALTSFNAAIRWMGAARWRSLHRAVYLIALLAILHFFWMRTGKRNFDQVAIYAAIIGVLLAWRLRRRFMRTTARPGTSP